MGPGGKRLLAVDAGSVSESRTEPVAGFSPEEDRLVLKSEIIVG